MAEFADQVALRVKAGDGGHGCASIRREKFKPLAGPDGGNGGRGGDVILEVDPGTATLLDFHRRPVRRAGSGKQGSGSNRNGAAGGDLDCAPRPAAAAITRSRAAMNSERTRRISRLTKKRVKPRAVIIIGIRIEGSMVGPPMRNTLSG